MALGRGHIGFALALSACVLAGCIVVREKDPCANGACEAIPLPDRSQNVDGTEPTTTKSAPLSENDTDSGAGTGAADGGTDAAGQGTASGEPCEERLDCDGAELCCYFGASMSAACAFENECRMKGAFFVCKSDSDCPSPLRCLAQTSTGHRACF
jgi:hypothetical protein